MKSSDDLFILIKSLTKSERRYFRLFSGLHAGDKKYLLLFEELLKQEEFDEAAVKKKYAKEKFVRQLTYTKNYLYQAVLRSLSLFHGGSFSEVAGLLHRAELLHERGLYKQCGKLINKAKQLCLRHENHLLQLEAARLEEKLMRSLSYAGITDKSLERAYAEKIELMDRHKNICDYSLLSDKLAMRAAQKRFARRGQAGTDRIIRHPLLRSASRARSFDARYYYHQCLGYYSYGRNDFAAARHHVGSMVQLMEAHAAAADPRLYVSALNNLAVCLHRLGRHDAIPPVIAKLRRTADAAGPSGDDLVHTVNNLEMYLYVSTGEFEKGIKLMQSAEEQARRRKMPSPGGHQALYWQYYAACIYFEAGNYTGSVRRLNRILNISEPDANSDVYYFSRILSLVVHFELGDVDLMSYLVRSTYRFLQKRKKLYRFEAVVLEFIIRPVTGTGMKEAFTRLKKQMDAIMRDPSERRALDYFDFMSWVESKISGESFAGIVRRKSLVISHKS